MPTQTSDPRPLAEAAVAALVTLAAADPTLTDVLDAAIGAIRGKYPKTSAGPDGPPTATHNPPVL